MSILAAQFVGPLIKGADTIPGRILLEYSFQFNFIVTVTVIEGKLQQETNQVYSVQVRTKMNEKREKPRQTGAIKVMLCRLMTT